MSGPLTGVRVIEISMFQQGPVAGKTLGDLGADVIKVETKEGDPGRGMMRIISNEAKLKGHNYYFEHCNRNKRSVIIDLKTEAGREVFFKLIDQADVFLSNLSIEAPIKLGIGPDDLCKRNPRLIYAQASGWGRKGPDANLYSFDYAGIARTGLMMSCGEAGAPPSQVLPGIADEAGALMCAFGVTAALYAREKTGRGQVVDTSLMGGMIALLGMIMAAPAILGQEYPRLVRAQVGNPLYNHYRCLDDKWLVIAHLQPDRYWPHICRALGMQELEHDTRFNTIEARGKNAHDLIQIMDTRFATRTREAWLQILTQEGCICTPIQSPLEVTNDLQALANDYIIEVQHSTAGKIKMPGFPWYFSENTASWRMEAPKLGEHTEGVLREIGYTPDEIARLRDSGAVGLS